MAVRGANPGALRVVLERATRKELTKVAILVQTEAKILCPVDTGRLRQSIGWSMHGSSPETMSVRVGSNVKYALVVEKGHGEIRPVRAKALRFPVKGGRVVYAKKVRPVAGQPYLRPALHAVRRAA